MNKRIDVCSVKMMLPLLLHLLSACRPPPVAHCPPAVCPVDSSERTKKDESTELEDSEDKLAGLFHTSRHGILSGNGMAVSSVSFGPEGEYFAVGGAYGKLEIRRLSDGRLVRKLGDENELEEGLMVRFSRNGTMLASAGHDLNGVRIWDPDTGELLREWNCECRRITGFAVAGDDLVLVGGDTGRVEGVSLSTGKGKGHFRMPYGQEIAALETDEAGMVAVAADVTGDVEIYNLQSWQRVGRVSAEKRLHAFAVAPGGDRLAVALGSGVVRFHNLPFGDRDESVSLRSRGRVETMRFSPGGDMLATALHDSSVELYSTKDGGRLAHVVGKGSPVLDLTFDKSGKVLAGVEQDMGVHLWWNRNLGFEIVLDGHAKRRSRPRKESLPETPEMLREFRVTVIRDIPFPISRMAIDRRGNFVAASGLPEQTAVWNVITGDRLWHSEQPSVHVARREYEGVPDESQPVVLSFHPANSRLYAFGKSNRIHRWDPRTGDYIRFLLNPRGIMKGLLFAEDGGSFFVLLRNGVVRRYTTAGKIIRNFKTLENPYWIGVCQTGRLFVSVEGWDGVMMHAVETGQELWRKPSGLLRRFIVRGMEFDRNCRRFMTYHDTGFVRIHDAETGELKSRHLVGFPGDVSACVFHRDHDWIGCAFGRTVEFRDIRKGVLLARIEVPVGVAGEILDIQLNLKDDTLLARVGDRSLVVWDFKREGFEEGRSPDEARPEPLKIREPGIREPRLIPGRREPKVPDLHFQRKQFERKTGVGPPGRDGFTTGDDEEARKDSKRKPAGEKKGRGP